MPENRRATSIARRINASHVWSMFKTMLKLDVLIILLAVIFWCYSVKNTLGSDWTIKLIRDVQTEGLTNNIESFSSVIYTFEYGGETFSANAGIFLQSMYRIMYSLLIVEAFMLITAIFTGSKKTDRLLMPLEQMSQTAEQLSQVQFDEQRYHDLENAIAAISPEAPEDRIHIGDRELQGLENAVNNLLTRLHNSYRQQNRFVSDVSHELRTPISVIQGYADMLARWGAEDEKVLEESINAIRTEAKHMQKMVEQLLFLARGDAGRNQLSAKDVDLSALVKEVHDEYEMIESEHNWVLQADEPTPAYADPDLLKQALRILTDNAIKYSAKGTNIVFRAFINDDEEPCVCVQDSGVGMAAEDIPHIFDRFFRSDPARTRNSGGTGLGLSIAKWIVERHNGYFNVLSREGFGTRIELVLPKADKAKELLQVSSLPIITSEKSVVHS